MLGVYWRKKIQVDSDELAVGMRKVSFTIKVFIFWEERKDADEA